MTSRAITADTVAVVSATMVRGRAGMLLPHTLSTTFQRELLPYGSSFSMHDGRLLPHSIEDLAALDSSER